MNNTTEKCSNSKTNLVNDSNEEIHNSETVLVNGDTSLDEHFPSLLDIADTPEPCAVQSDHNDDEPKDSNKDLHSKFGEKKGMRLNKNKSQINSSHTFHETADIHTVNFKAKVNNSRSSLEQKEDMHIDKGKSDVPSLEQKELNDSESADDLELKSKSKKSYEINKKLREQLNLLQMGKRRMSILDTTPLYSDKTPKSSRSNSPPSFRRTCSSSAIDDKQIIKRNVGRKVLKKISKSDRCTRSSTFERINNSATKVPEPLACSTPESKNNFIDFLINKIKKTKPIELGSKTDATTSSLTPTKLDKSNQQSLASNKSIDSPLIQFQLSAEISEIPIKPSTVTEEDASSNHSDNFYGFTDTDIVTYTRPHIPGMLPTPVVTKVSGKHAAFISEELDSFMEENALDNVSNIVLPPKQRHDEAMVGPDAVPPRLVCHRPPDDCEKPRTVAEKRQMLAKKTDIKYLMIENESTIYREIKKRSKSGIGLYNNELINNIQQMNIPFTRDCWRAAAWLNTRNGRFYFKTVIGPDGKECKLYGSRGNNRNKVLLKKLETKKSLSAIRRPCTSVCHNLDNIKINNLETIMPYHIKMVAPKTSTTNIEKSKKLITACAKNANGIRTGPLCQKLLSNKLRSSFDLELGPLEIYNMPKVKLQVWPKLDRSLPENILPYMKSVLPYECITPEWAKFAVSAVHQIKYGSKRKRQPAKLTPSESEKHQAESFTFDIPYCNNQKKILIRKRKQLTLNDIKVDIKNVNDFGKPLQFAANINSKDELAVEVSEVLTDMINSVAVSLNETSFVNDDPDIDYENAASAVTKTEKISTSVEKVKKEKRSKVMIELKRLNATIINAYTPAVRENCNELHCKFGCICDSLSVKKQVALHCKKVDCMFDCKCPNNTIKGQFNQFEDNTNNANMQQLRDRAASRLAKEEREFTATVVVSQDKTVYMPNSDNLGKRSKRMPKRFNDCVKYVDDSTSQNIETVLFNNMVQKTEATPSAVVPFETKPKVHNDIVERLRHAVVLAENLNVLSNYEPWCMVHRLYKCFCKLNATKGNSFEYDNFPAIQRETMPAAAPPTVALDDSQLLEPIRTVPMPKKRQYTFEKCDEIVPKHNTDSSRNVLPSKRSMPDAAATKVLPIVAKKMLPVAEKKSSPNQILPRKRLKTTGNLPEAARHRQVSSEPLSRRNRHHAKVIRVQIEQRNRANPSLLSLLKTRVKNSLKFDRKPSSNKTRDSDSVEIVSEIAPINQSAEMSDNYSLRKRRKLSTFEVTEIIDLDLDKEDSEPTSIPSCSNDLSKVSTLSETAKPHKSQRKQDLMTGSLLNYSNESFPPAQPDSEMLTEPLQKEKHKIVTSHQIQRPLTPTSKSTTSSSKESISLPNTTMPNSSIPSIESAQKSKPSLLAYLINQQKSCSTITSGPLQNISTTLSRPPSNSSSPGLSNFTAPCGSASPAIPQLLSNFTPSDQSSPNNSSLSRSNNVQILNRIVAQSMQNFKHCQQYSTKYLRRPTNKRVVVFPWTNLMEAFTEDLVCVWQIQKNTNEILLAITIENVMPIVAKATCVINIKAVDPNRLPTLARILRSGLINDQTKHMSVLLAGNCNYYRVIGCCHSEHRYLDQSTSAKPTPQTHPKVSKKIEVLFKALNVTLASESAKNQLADNLSTNNQLADNLSTNNQLPDNLSTNNQLTENLSANNNSDSNQNTKDIAKESELNFYTNIPITILERHEADKLFAPIAVIGPHRWLVLRLGTDFTHIRIPNRLLDVNKIKAAIKFSNESKKTIKLSAPKLEPDAYAVMHLNTIFFGPYKKNDPFNLVLLCNVNGKLETINRYPREKKVITTTGSWLNIDNNRLVTLNQFQNPPASNSNLASAQSTIFTDTADDCIIIEDDQPPSILSAALNAPNPPTAAKIVSRRVSLAGQRVPTTTIQTFNTISGMNSFQQRNQPPVSNVSTPIQKPGLIRVIPQRILQRRSTLHVSSMKPTFNSQFSKDSTHECDESPLVNKPFKLPRIKYSVEKNPSKISLSEENSTSAALTKNNSNKSFDINFIRNCSSMPKGNHNQPTFTSATAMKSSAHSTLGTVPMHTVTEPNMINHFATSTRFTSTISRPTIITSTIVTRPSISSSNNASRNHASTINTDISLTLPRPSIRTATASSRMSNFPSRITSTGPSSSTIALERTERDTWKTFSPSGQADKFKILEPSPNVILSTKRMPSPIITSERNSAVSIICPSVKSTTKAQNTPPMFNAPATVTSAVVHQTTSRPKHSSNEQQRNMNQNQFSSSFTKFLDNQLNKKLAPQHTRKPTSAIQPLDTRRVGNGLPQPIQKRPFTSTLPQTKITIKPVTTHAMTSNATQQTNKRSSLPVSNQSTVTRAMHPPLHQPQNPIIKQVSGTLVIKPSTSSSTTSTAQINKISKLSNFQLDSLQIGDVIMNNDFAKIRPRFFKPVKAAPIVRRRQTISVPSAVISSVVINLDSDDE